MALNRSIQVPMPTKLVTIRKQKEKQYVYYRTRIYRNEKGQPTSDVVLIGRKDPSTGNLIPNSTYYKYFGGTPKVQEPVKEAESILDYGNSYLLDYILDHYSVNTILDRAFPKHGKAIAALAKYMVCEGNVFYYCGDWCDTTYIGLKRPLTSQKSSEICASIDYDSRMNFFRTWCMARVQEEYLAYDVTSISSYSTGTDNVEWGYNRDDEILPQINMGMIFGETSKLPIYYSIYPGSLPDKSYLDYMLRDTDELGIHVAKFVMDKGFFTKENLVVLNDKTMRFIVSVPMSQKVPKRLLSESHGMQYLSKYSLGSGQPSAKTIEITDYGFRMMAHIFFDSKKFHEEETVFYAGLSQREAALKDMKKKPNIEKALDKYLTFTYADDGSFIFERNNDRIDEVISRFGFFIIYTTDFRLDSKEVLSIYRRKDLVEKCFDNLKNSIDMKRIRTHNNDTCEGKSFVAFIALILKSVLDNKLHDYMLKNNMTIEKVLKEMAKIRIVRFSEGHVLLNPITKRQREILEQFGITESELKSSILKL
jgi:transposase